MKIFWENIIYLLILFFIYSCTNITHEMAEDPPLIPLPKNTLQATIENAANVDKGFGTFGDINQANQNKIGRKLTTDNRILVSSLYQYENSLDNIFDTYDTGDLKEKKYVRITVNGKNIMSNEPNCLNLKPVAKNLADFIVTPQKDQCFIDPIIGRFVLPRPCYWSKLESIDNIENAEIYEKMPVAETIGGIYFDDVANSVKFSKGLHRIAWRKGNIRYGEEDGYRYIYPYGKNKKDWSKGTISAYAKVYTSFAVSYGVYARSIALINFIGDTDTFKIMLYSKCEEYQPVSYFIRINIAGNDLSVNNINNGELYHVYIVWDKDKELQGGKSVRVFLNGVEKSSTTNSLPDMSSFILKTSLYNYAKGTTFPPTNWGEATGETYLDNLKVWNSVVSEDPSWEYNREDALHIMYGENNNYQPNDIKVGYYYVP